MRKLTVLVMSIAMLAAFGSAASAAPGNGNGAQVSHQHTCTVDSPAAGQTECIDADFEGIDRVTPSGNEIQSANGSFCDTIYDSTSGDVIYHFCENDVHAHYLFKSDGTVLHEEGVHYTIIETSGGVTCTEVLDLHMANGRLQFNRDSLICTP